jgi:hypothetical protein
VTLTFAEHGPRLERDINAEPFEIVLSYSRTRGSGRLLIAALDGLSDSTGMVDSVTTDELRDIAGLADRTYRRAREQLLNSGDVQLVAVGGGRARTNCWRIRDPRLIEQRPLLAPRSRPALSRSARPLFASAKPGPVGGHPQPATDDQPSTSPALNGDQRQNPGQSRTLSGTNPGRNPGAQRAHGKGTSEPKNHTPQPP